MLDATQLGEMWSHAQVACMFVGSALRRIDEAQKADQKSKSVGPWEHAVDRLALVSKDLRVLERDAATLWERSRDADSADMSRPLVVDVIGLAVRHVDVMLEHARQQLRERALDATDGEVRS